MATSLLQLHPEHRPSYRDHLWPLPSTRLLRLSVTDRCNFRCRYCMPAEGVPGISHGELLSLEQLAEMVRWLSRYTSIERVKLTGGEPLVRRGLEHLVAELSTLPRVREISLTTNGSLLARQAQILKESGLARVSVSLDSLDPERFAELSRGGQLKNTLAGIDAALQAGLVPLKLNTVLQRSTWQRDVPMLLDFAAERGLEPRFIELMRTGTERAWCDSEFVAVDEVREWLEERTPVVSIPTPAGVPARQSQIRWAGRLLDVGWIAPRSHPFCTACERVRLDARGRLRRCLMDPEALDLVRLRQTQGDESMDALYTYLRRKQAPDGMDSEYAMSQIGG
ncbi:MAG: GTP 3',8-cyclase MoaA [Acidobacteriia bacterium]|nr:GTP 3',8-cyclase MoaA [Terriglobia bacterium]